MNIPYNCERSRIIYSDWFENVSYILRKSTSNNYYNGNSKPLGFKSATTDVWSKSNSEQKKALTRTQGLELFSEIISEVKSIHLLNGKETL